MWRLRWWKPIFEWRFCGMHLQQATGRYWPVTDILRLEISDSVGALMLLLLWLSPTRSGGAPSARRDGALLYPRPLCGCVTTAGRWLSIDSAGEPCQCHRRWWSSVVAAVGRRLPTCRIPVDSVEADGSASVRRQHVGIIEQTRRQLIARFAPGGDQLADARGGDFQRSDRQGDQLARRQ